MVDVLIPIHRLASILETGVIRYSIMCTWTIAIEKPAFIEQADLAPILLMESAHELITEPLGQGNPSSTG